MELRSFRPTPPVKKARKASPFVMSPGRRDTTRRHRRACGHTLSSGNCVPALFTSQASAATIDRQVGRHQVSPILTVHFHGARRRRHTAVPGNRYLRKCSDHRGADGQHFTHGIAVDAVTEGYMNCAIRHFQRRDLVADNFVWRRQSRFDIVLRHTAVCPVIGIDPFLGEL